MNVLGISAFYHDAAAALVVDGKIVSACQEERFTRIKHDKQFPRHSIDSVLSIAKLKTNQLDKIVFYESIDKKSDRVFSQSLSQFPSGLKFFGEQVKNWALNRFNIRKQIIEYLNESAPDIRWEEKVLFTEHHLSHAASAFFPSPFKNSAVVIIDGVGEWSTTSIYKGTDAKLTKLSEIKYPNSLGLLYSAFTEFVGFKVNSGEYKLMGLAPYGNPVFADVIKKNLIEIYEDGSFHLNLEFFDFMSGDHMINSRFEKLFDMKTRNEENNLNISYANIASSIQSITNEVVIKIAKYALKLSESSNLCLAGGVALNCVSNGLLLNERKIKNLWIQPAAGDAGGAVGAALIGTNISKKLERKHVGKSDAMLGTYLGPFFSNDEIKLSLENLGAKFNFYQEDVFLDKVANLLAENNIIGWFQGRMEFGPRALGSRSIIGNPMNDEMQSIMNLKIKYRESFRPFAPAVLLEDKEKYFDLKTDSPYMLLVADIKKELRLDMDMKRKKDLLDWVNTKRSTIPAVTHVDYSARIQTVDSETNPKYYSLINKFKEKTKCSVIINTSFNVRGEPIVCTPDDAFKCFMGTQMDILAIGNYILFKEEQDYELTEDYLDKYELD